METASASFSDPLSNESANILTNCETLESFTSNAFKVLIEATKKSNSLPIGKSRDLYESYPIFHEILEKQADHVLSTMSTMMKHSNCRGCIKKKDDDEKFEMIVEANDTLLENVGTTLDELSGIVRNQEAKFTTKKSTSVSGSWNKSKSISNKGATQLLNKIFSQTKNIEKPQLKFKDKVDNNSNTPFEPRIKYKYNMLKPLSFISEKMDDGSCQYSHPYEFELEKFKPPQEQLVHKPPIMFKSLDDTPLILVTSPEDVVKVVDDLEKYKEIAVDLEHHSYRSFQGFTCLMQISTRDTDYIIDTLSLRCDLEILNKVFTNPLIVKVFHGADSDILWLQRDLSLYIVNMFDTHQAAKLLNFPKLSLSFLLSHYCKVNAQKQFQLADWRVRPLPQELLSYAREDTHYLLYIYDSMRNALIEKANHQTNLLESVISESTRICLKRYLKPVFNVDGYLDLYHRSKKLFDNRQKFALQQLFKWRDTIARESDESYGYVFPDHMMLNVSEVLPREVQGILACCNPIPVPVRQNVLALHQIILKAREQPLIKPVLEEERFYRHTASVLSFDDPLHCPHDLSHEGDIRDDLPVLINGNNPTKADENSSAPTSFEWPKPIINVFEQTLDASKKAKIQLIANRVMHLTPYHRYKLTKKYTESVGISPLSNEKHDSVQEQDCTPLSANSDKNLDETVDKSVILDKDSEDSNLNEEKDLGESEIKNNTKEQTINLNKRKVEVLNVSESKKPSEEINTLVINPYALKNNEIGGNKKKRKITLGKRDKEFQPFNFNSVDFKKYNSSEVTTSKKPQKKFNVKKRLHKKNFKSSF